MPTGGPSMGEGGRTGRTPQRDPLGRNALFQQGNIPAGGGGDGRRALYSGEQPGGRDGEGRRKGWSSFLRDPVVLECSRCQAVSEVELVDFALLHLPAFLWHPGKGFTHLLTCPACRRRCWMSVSRSR